MHARQRFLIVNFLSLVNQAKEIQATSNQKNPKKLFKEILNNPSNKLLDDEPSIIKIGAWLDKNNNRKYLIYHYSGSSKKMQKRYDDNELNPSWFMDLSAAIEFDNLESSLDNFFLENDKINHTSLFSSANYSSDWIQEYNKVDAYEHGKKLSGNNAIHQYLVEADYYAANPYHYLLIYKKPKWYLYHLNKGNLVIRNVEQDPSLKDLSEILQGYSLKDIKKDSKISVNVQTTLSEYFYKKAKIRIQEQAIARNEPRAIQEMHSSPWDHNHDSESQADYIWETYVQPLLDSGKRVALLYSANQKQAEMLYKCYNHFNISLSSIFAQGSGQAKVFEKIALRIEKYNLRDQVHILPIPTSLEGGDDADPKNKVSREQIDASLENVAMHKGADFSIFALVDDEGHYLIGGGRSKNWDKPDESGFNRKEHVEDVLNSISKDNELESKIEHAYQLGTLQPKSLSLFFMNLTSDLSNRLKDIDETTHPVIKKMKNALNEFTNDKDKNIEKLWKQLVVICKDQIKPFKRNSPQIDLLCRSIAEFDTNLRLKPGIETLDQLIIMQQKREAIINWVDVEKNRLKKEWKETFSTGARLKVAAYKGLKGGILLSDKNTPLSDLIAQDSPLLQSTVKSTGQDGIPYEYTFQQLLYRKRGPFLSQATSKSKLEQLRNELFAVDPRTVLNFNQKTLTGDDIVSKLSLPQDFRSHKILSKLLALRDIFVQNPQQKDHVDDINHLINDIVYILQRSENPEQNNQLIINKIKEAFDREERRFREPTLGLFGKSGQDFRNVLKTDLKYYYSRRLLEILNDNSPTINPNDSTNTSDHTYQSICVNFLTNSQPYQVKGLTWNLMDRMYPKREENLFSNNPWNAEENFDKYFARKKRQLQQLFSMIKNGEIDFAFLQEVDIFVPEKKSSKYQFENEQLENIKALKDNFISKIKELGWEITPQILATKGSQQPLVTLYNKNVFEPIKTNPIGIIHIPDDIPHSMRGTSFRVTHKESNQSINLTNVHLKYGHQLDKPYNDELMDHKQGCINREERGEILIAGGDFNRPSSRIENAVADSNRITNLESEILQNPTHPKDKTINDPPLIHLKRKHDDVLEDKNVNNEKEYKAYDYFIVNGTKDCFIQSVKLGGKQLQKISKGQYSVVDSREKELFPYQIIDGSYSFAERDKCEKFLEEIKQELGSYIEEYKNKQESKLSFLHSFIDSNYILNCQQKKYAAESLLGYLNRNHENIKEDALPTLKNDSGRLGKIYQKCMTLPNFNLPVELDKGIKLQNI